MTTAAVLLAAGSGTRLEATVPKAFMPLGGRPMFTHSLEAMASSGVVDLVVLVVPEDRVAQARAAAAGLAASTSPIVVVAGGATRQGSVGRGIAAVPIEAGSILCHDAARPFATPGLFARVAEALASGMEDRPAARAEGVVPTIATPDTVKRIRDGVVVETIPRSETGLVQTPQGFSASALRQAHARALVRGQSDATDDAMLLEAAGFRVVAVPGEPGNFKVTTREDLLRAEKVLSERGRTPA